MIPLFLAQLGLPLALVLWLLLRPPRSRAGLLAQLGGSLLALAGLRAVGLWLFPPWWVPAAAAAVLLAAGAVHLRRPRPFRPRGWPGWVGVALFGALGVAGATLAWTGRASSRPPPRVELVELAFPLPSGRYLVANGGEALATNAHARWLDTSDARLRPWHAVAHGVDLVAVDALGRRASGLLPESLEAYRSFGVPVSAPCAGTVVAAVDGLPDMPVPRYDRANLAGNHVILACGDAHVVLAHFRRGSLRVMPGERVETGAPLGQVGNSGGTSEPHLHVHAQRPGPSAAPLSGEPLRVRLGGRYLSRGDRVRVH